MEERRGFLLCGTRRALPKTRQISSEAGQELSHYIGAAVCRHALVASEPGRLLQDLPDPALARHPQAARVKNLGYANKFGVIYPIWEMQAGGKAISNWLW